MGDKSTMIYLPLLQLAFEENEEFSGVGGRDLFWIIDQTEADNEVDDHGVGDGHGAAFGAGNGQQGMLPGGQSRYNAGDTGLAVVFDDEGRCGQGVLLCFFFAFLNSGGQF